MAKPHCHNKYDPKGLSAYAIICWCDEGEDHEDER